MKRTSNVTVVSNQHASMPPEFALRVIDSDAAKLPVSFGISQDYEIIWIVEGAGVYFIDFHQGQLSDNHVFVIRPGQQRRIFLDHCKEGYVFSFSSAFLQAGELELDLAGQAQLLQLFCASPQVVADGETIEDLREVANRLLKEFHRGHPFQAELLRRYLKILLIYLVREFGSGSTPPVGKAREMELVQQFMQMLNKHYRDMKMVAEYADELSIKPNYLNDIVKKNTGNTASFHIRQRIVLEAKRMAIYSSTSMKEIAYDLGYSDPCHFSKFFRVATGVNFSTFKSEKKKAFAF